MLVRTKTASLAPGHAPELRHPADDFARRMSIEECYVGVSLRQANWRRAIVRGNTHPSRDFRSELWWALHAPCE
jgi:hypothetical protein